ncbi:MAG: Uncharacterized protein HW383_33 [Candidatus Magasanikbacteria bacterium]|nr:Uncharacterized protein [Candidatus Magasanikbacteria bacterium]
MLNIRIKKGFTLIELIIVMAIIAILALIIFVAVDPSRRIHAANNANRASNVNAILNAYLNYVADNKGTHVTSTTSNVAYMIGQGSTGGTCAATATTLKIDLRSLVDNYISSIPYDPVTGMSTETRYYYIKSTNTRVTIGACDPEAEGTTTPVIFVQR